MALRALASDAPPSAPSVAFPSVPPLPLTSAIVDPRIGDHGPALLALEDGSIFPRSRSRVRKFGFSS